MKRFCKRFLCLALTLALCAGLLTVFTVSASAVTLEEKQRAVVLTAFAYYDKGRPVQYDSKGLSDVSRVNGGAIRTTQDKAPEFATPDETIYSVCSNFCYQVYLNAFGYRVHHENPIYCLTENLSKYNTDDPICAYKYDSATDNTPRAEAITKFLEALQPGDIINSVSAVGSGGHAMLYIGDFFGDGTNYILHCTGYKYDNKTGEDVIECSPGKAVEIPGKIRLCTEDHPNDNGISLDSAEEYLRGHYGKSKNRVFSAIRPLNVIKDEEFPLTDAAKGRLQFPRLVYNRTASPYTRFNDVPEGGTLTLKVELKNCSKEAYTVPVKETVPDGVTFVKASDGGKVSGKEITWLVTIPAGETKTVSYDCTVNAKRGETVTFTGGSAGTIPSNTLKIPVGGKHLTDAENALLAEVAEGKHMELFRGAKKDEVPDVVWQKLLKLNVATPAGKELFKGVLKKTELGGKTVFVPRDDLQGALLTYRNMLVPNFHGGRVHGEMVHRVLDLKCAYLQPGDVVLEIKEATMPSSGQTLVYLGDGKFLGQGASGTEVVDFFELQKAFIYDLFFALRPTLAFDDVHTLTAVVKPEERDPRFTDVKKSDWFFDYVEDLADEGTISGMTETTFEPNGTLTYGQALKLIGGALGEKEPKKSGTHWASGWLSLAKKNKWVSGDVDLDAPITRLAFCQIASKAKGITSQPKTNPFTDTSEKAVLALNKAGIINGMTETTFEPETLLTRAQIAKIILRLTLRK